MNQTSERKLMFMLEVELEEPSKTEAVFAVVQDFCAACLGHAKKIRIRISIQVDANEQLGLSSLADLNSPGQSDRGIAVPGHANPMPSQPKR